MIISLNNGFTLKSKKEFQHSAMGAPSAKSRPNPFRLQSLSHSHFSSGICLFCLSARIIPSCCSSVSPSARRLTLQSKRMFWFQWSAPPDEHPVTLDDTNCKNVDFFFVIVYKYRNKINYSMLASYCCRLPVPFSTSVPNPLPPHTYTWMMS